MSPEDKLTPEELLEAIKKEESVQTHGKLKIFVGMAAGVGKTYAMLEEARHLKQEGVDIVIGTVDTHGRQETARLMEGLPIIPKKMISYKDKNFEEMDLDAILQRRPEIFLVDELAHSNIPGSRHAKRWEDVVEILENKIDVYTTLNVQHIESLNDVIQGIADISVRETVPDLIIEKADLIQLVDLTPDELLQRLKEGKVYIGNQSKVAADHFFQKNRLTALREVVLRYAAEKVDRDLHDIVSGDHRITGWKPREKLLVAISSNPHSQRLIRTTRRLAFNLDAPWIAVYVNDGRVLSEEDNLLLTKNLSLARQLGAEVITTNDPNIPEAILRIAKQRGITQIVLGRPPRRPFFWMFKGFSILDKIAVQCTDIDLHVIRQTTPFIRGQGKALSLSLGGQLTPYVLVLILSIILALINFSALPVIGYKVSGFIFLVGILSFSLFFKKGPIFFASLFYALTWSFFFIPPTDSFNFTFNEDKVLLGLYFLTSIATGILVDRARENKEMLTKREQSAQALYDIFRQIATASSKEEVLKSIKEQFQRLFGGHFEIYIKTVDNGLTIHVPSPLIEDEKEKAAALWVFEKEKEAGWSTSTLPLVKNLYLPIRSFKEMMGVLVYRPKGTTPLSMEEMNFIHTVTQQLAHYLERSFAEERTHLLTHLDQKEKIYQTVLSSLSTELENPLLSIQEAVYEAMETLREQPVETEKKAIDRQIHKIEDSSEKLLRILESVSAMAKLSGKLVPIRKEFNSLKEVIQLSYQKVRPLLENRKVIFHIENTLPPVPFDFFLIEVLLYNLLINAIQYSEDGTQIEIEAKKGAETAIVSISDEGCGIPPDMLDAIFEKFTRIPGQPTSGIGLGLAIAKKIADYHEGDLKAENRPKKGAKFSLYLPLKSNG